jgi:hypothetical protein
MASDSCQHHPIYPGAPHKPSSSAFLSAMTIALPLQIPSDHPPHADSLPATEILACKSLLVSVPSQSSISSILQKPWTPFFPAYLNPNQGVPDGVGFDTTNTIDGLGNLSSVTAKSLDGWALTLHNTTSASAFTIVPYVDPITCCSPVDPAVMLAAAQGIGNYGFADHSINLAYDLGTIANHQSVSFGYEYIMAVPEPETYAMLLAGLGLIGFSARRRRMM